MKAAIYIHSPNFKNIDFIREFEKTNLDKVIFFNSSLPYKIDAACFHGIHTWKWRAPIIATCVDTAHFILKNPAPTKKFLLVSSIDDWYNERNSVLNLEAYRKLQLICKNDDVEIIKKIWGVNPISGDLTSSFIEEIFNDNAKK